MRRRVTLAATLSLATVVGGGAMLLATPTGRPGETEAASTTLPTAAIARKTLHATTQVDGTLSYDGSVSVSNALATAPGGDTSAGDQAYATARSQYDQAVAALHALRHPTSAELGPLRTQLAQATASVTQVRASLGVDRAALRAARQASADCSGSTSANTGAPCDASALALAVRQARARVDGDRAQLAAAEAGSGAASAALHAKQHPTRAQVKQAKDAVAVARAGLDAAAAKRTLPAGVLTAIAEVGAVAQPGDTLYTLDGAVPVVLMQGDVPAWRDLGAGVADGPDIEQLETNLVALGDADPSLTPDAHWDAGTTAAAERWQASLGIPQTGRIALGSIVFEPAPLRITGHQATLGATLQQGTPVLTATSTDRVVTVALDPALQTQVKVGDAVSVVLPDGSTAPGAVSDVGSVASVPSGNDNSPPGSGNQTPTIDVSITLDDPSVAGTLDQAPVTVNITTATADNVLAVPVNALLELLEGGYAIQVDDGGQLRYVPVTLGLFADGWVQISGPGLDAGQTVVVAQ